MYLYTQDYQNEDAHMKQSPTHTGSGQASQTFSLRSIWRKTFSRFHFVWMVILSLIFCALIFLGFNGVEMLTSLVISSSGHVALTSGDYGFFFRTWQGYVTIAILLVSVLLILDILLNAIILLSDDFFHMRRINLLGVFKRSFRSIRLFLCWKALPLVLYYAIFIAFFVTTILAIVPNPFEIPRYILYVINKKPLYMLLYAGAFLLVLSPLINNPLIVHDMLLGQQDPESARKRTSAYVKGNRGIVNRKLFLSVLIIFISLVIAGAIFLGLPMLCQLIFRSFSIEVRRIAVLTAAYLGLSILVLTVLVIPWILTMAISELYNAMIQDQGITPAATGSSPTRTIMKSRHIFRILLAVYLILLIAAVTISDIHFNYIYPPAKHIEAVVHRLGGDMDTENTMEGLEKAIEAGAPAVETDIQRTKDGEYVIFHDRTLKRMCGESLTVSEMTLEELQQYTLPSPVFEEERHIPLLTEVLDQANGRIRLYLELKGSTADIQMARDVTRMVKERGMEKDCVLISMNYHLITYINNYIPDIPCGYLYFFAYGMESKLSGNYLMAQSNAINSSRTRAIHSQGKKVYCWTVNSMETAQNMVRQRVDGIITDRYDIVASVLDHQESRNDYERIMDVLLS